MFYGNCLVKQRNIFADGLVKNVYFYGNGVIKQVNFCGDGLVKQVHIYGGEFPDGLVI